jgi:NADPH2:quinone reductase
MSGKPMEIPAGDLVFRQALVKGFWFSKLLQTKPPNEIAAAISELLGLVENDAIRLQVDAIFDLDKVAEAVRANVTGR